ncbi:reverse transcriptase domain-containing protein [Rhodopseudomonas parapalustris]
MEKIVSDANMREAYRRTLKGHRHTYGYLQFKEYADVNLKELADDVAAGTYRPGPVRQFMVYEPKPRPIAALGFRDRVAQHALCNVIGPIFEKVLLPRTYACRVGRGTHGGVKNLQATLRRLGTPCYALKTDFSKYFASIDRAVLHRLIRRKISCQRTLRMIEAITPDTGCGVPIGSLTSQLWANVYGNEVDRYLQCHLREKHWFRYMDDVVVLGADPAHLRHVKEEIEWFARDRLHLRLSKWSVASVSRGVNFLGFRVWASHKLLRKQSVVRARRRLLRFRQRGQSAEKFLAAWMGHLSWADSFNLKCRLLLASRQVESSHYTKPPIPFAVLERQLALPDFSWWRESMADVPSARRRGDPSDTA